jgi:hypothetical protein
MKGSIWGKGVLGVLGVLGLSMVTTQAAEPSAAVGTATTNSPTGQMEKVPPGALIFRGPNAGKAPSVSAGTNAAAARMVLPATLNLPPGLAEVVRLQASGVGDEVILGHIQNSPALNPITADQIVYLKDLGISPRVLTALLQHQRPDTSEAAPAPEESMPPMAPGAEDGASLSPEDYSETATLPGPLYFNPVDYGYVYDALAPYGSWLDLPDYGWSWQPTACRMNHSWRPYCDNGRWRWSDSGWYWDSRYSWGWAPFHYGRWSQHPQHGWVWHPDRTWAPAWVSWRNSADACGWAPLPPGADFTLNTGWTLHGRPVNAQQPDFGLAPSAFTFVDKAHFLGPAQHRFNWQQGNEAFQRTRPVEGNGFRLAANHRTLNVGVDPKQVQAAAAVPLRPAAIRVGFSSRTALANTSSSGQRSWSLSHRTEASPVTRNGTFRQGGQSSSAGGSAAATWMGAGEHHKGHVAQYPTSGSSATAAGGPVKAWTPYVGATRNAKPGLGMGKGSGVASGSALVFPFGKPAMVITGGTGNGNGGGTGVAGGGVHK